MTFCHKVNFVFQPVPDSLEHPTSAQADLVPATRYPGEQCSWAASWEEAEPWEET